MNSKIAFFLIVLSVFIFSCNKWKNEALTPYTLKIPSHFPQMPVPSDNPMTVEGVALGKKLFYDPRLSKDNSISCASCHRPDHAFSDPNVISAGVGGTLGRRQAMPLFNLGWQQFYFWDGRAKTLEEQILFPVPDPVEMHQSWEETIEKLAEDKEYKKAFQHYFKEKGIDKYKVAKLIAQFLRTLISGSSKYDIMYKTENNLALSSEESAAVITPEEWAGYALFKDMNGADCIHCHNGVLMQIQAFSNNGLDDEFTDQGRAEVTKSAADMGKFKVPSLRNIGYTAPYMHDGRFATIDEVINHYSFNVKTSSSIDPLMEFAFQGGVQLTEEQRAYLKAFLKTLDDEKFVANPEFRP
ncbi:MAG: cytochrome-c peroxidase [Flavobacteriia bacterium]|nr:cytochrome-c peroxidase [Flavobacteriia bacterium]